jgi:hypothetical protein
MTCQICALFPRLDPKSRQGAAVLAQLCAHCGWSLHLHQLDEHPHRLTADFPLYPGALCPGFQPDNGVSPLQAIEALKADWGSTLARHPLTADLRPCQEPGCPGVTRNPSGVCGFPHGEVQS